MKKMKGIDLKLVRIKSMVSKPNFWIIFTGVCTFILLLLSLYQAEFKIRPIFICISEVANIKIPLFVLVYAILGILFIIFVLRKTRRLNKKEKFIVSILGKRELGFKILFKTYKTKFEKESRIISNCVSTVGQLKKRGLVESPLCSGRINGITDELWRLTNKGKKQYDKIDETKEEAEQILRHALSEGSQEGDKPKRLEPHDEVIFILNELANQRDERLHKDILRSKYFGMFKNKTEADFNIVWRKLEREELVGIYGYNSRHSITGEGLDYLGRDRTSK